MLTTPIQCGARAPAPPRAKAAPRTHLATKQQLASLHPSPTNCRPLFTDANSYVAILNRSSSWARTEPSKVNLTRVEDSAQM